MVMVILFLASLHHHEVIRIMSAIDVTLAFVPKN